VARVVQEPFFIFGEEDFAWDEPELQADGAAAAAIPVAPPLRPVRRRRQTRTLAGDLARLREAVGLSPLGLAVVFAFLIAAAVSIRILVGGGSTELPATGNPPPTQPARRTEAATKDAPTTPAPRPAKALERGDKGAAVRDLQAALTALGFSTEAPDGAFGPGTAAAVAAFQGGRGLEVDGVAGPLTAAGLVELAVERADADAAEVETGLGEAVAAGRLEEKEAARYRAALDASLSTMSALPPGRSATVAVALHDIAANASSFEGPRAFALFAMLEANARYLVENPLPASWDTMVAEDGVVYRYFPAHGFQFHPLANFARLNKLVAKGKREEVRKLTTALAARAVPLQQARVWEYYFPFGGPTLWTSGFAQAVGAQALARSGALLDDPELFALARAAFRAIPASYAMDVGGGLWIQEYSYGGLAILNAQLQSLISLSDYVRVSDDRRAREVVTRMELATRALLPRFDTGCWSRYALDGAPASLHYHTYHVTLLRHLGQSTRDPLWTETAVRWEGYLRAGDQSGGCA
jgi:peptidoglycan hydrolase-like protein with peptidoglycan-binding domain